MPNTQNPTILSIQSSGRKNASTTRLLSRELLDHLLGLSPAATLVERDLTDGIPFVDEDWIEANFTPPENRTAAQSATLGFSEQLVEELERADVIVLGTPIYNFGIPALLKAWIDQIARARRTFRYTENGPVGLLENKKAYVVVASGGTSVGSEIDFATGYLRHVLGFIGIHDVRLIAADAQMRDAEAALARARLEISAITHNYAV